MLGFDLGEFLVIRGNSQFVWRQESDNKQSAMDSERRVLGLRRQSISFHSTPNKGRQYLQCCPPVAASAHSHHSTYSMVI